MLDAINFANGLMPTAAPQNIRLVRPAPAGACCEQILPVNLAAITSGGDPTTNYQLMPGDRIVVYRDPIVRFTVFLDRLAAPFQTVIGTTLQTAFTIRCRQVRGVPVGRQERRVRREQPEQQVVRRSPTYRSSLGPGNSICRRSYGQLHRRCAEITTHSPTAGSSRLRSRETGRIAFRPVDRRGRIGTVVDSSPIYG